MKPKRVLANLLLLLAIALAGAVAQPANDHFANATLLSGLSGSVDGSTIGATRELFEPRHWYGGDEADAPSVWYRWVAPASGTVRFGTCGAASFPTAMVAYTGLLHNNTLQDAARQLPYDIPSCASPGGRMTLPAVAGVTYHIAVAGRQEGSTGTFRLDWEYVRPENDDFADATLLSGPWGAVVGSHEGATVEPGEPDHGQAAARASIWWRWTAPDNGDWIFEACGSEFNVVLAVYTGAALEDLAPVQANRSHCGGGSGRGAKFRARTGTTYAIAVDSEEGNPELRGAVQLSWGKWGDTRQQLGLGRRPWSVAFAGADALRYVTSSSRGALLRDTQTDDVIRILSGHARPVGSIAVSRDGSRIATGGGSVAYLWDAVTGMQLAGFAGHAAHSLQVRQVTLSPDAGFVATTFSDEKARIWNTSTGELLHVIPVEQGNWPFAVALTPDNSRFVIGSHSKVTVYDMATGNEIRVIPRPNEVVSTVAVSPDGTHLLTGTLTAAVTMWNLETGALVRTFTGHTGVNGGPVAFSRDGTRALVGSTEAVIWDAATGEVLQTFQNAEGVLSLDLSADNARLITASNDRNVRLWDATTGELLRVVPGYTEIVWDVAISGDGRRVATVSGDLGEGRAMIWDYNTGGLLRDFLAHAQMPTAVAISSDGRRLLTGSLEYVARYWDAESGELLHELPHAFYVTDVAISADGTRLLTTSWDKTARMWNAATGTLLRTFTGHTAPVTACALAPDNSQVATGSSDGTIIVWNPETASVIRTLEGGNHFRSLVYSSDGAHLLGCSEFAGARLWNAATGELLRTFHDRSSPFHHATFSPDDTRILTAHDRGVLRLWDTQTGDLLRTFHGHTEPASAAVFTSDGSRVVSGSQDGTALVWELAPPRAIIVAGGGAYVGNPIARQTNDLGVYAWRTLRARGYAPEEILYLSAFPDGHDFGDGLPAVAWDLDGDGLHEVDGYATRAALEGALTGDFAREAGRLMILMIDHGYKTGDFMAFRLNPTEAVLTTTMNGWLNDLQNAAPLDVTLVVDSCYSGRFVLDCKKTDAIPAARDRIVIASTSPTAESVFLPAPDLTSFMHTFLGSAYMGNSMGEAWRSGQRFFARFPVANQRPMIDDGEVQASDDVTPTTRANREFFGASWAYGVQADRNINRFFPAFESVAPNGGTIGVGQPVTLRATLKPYQRPDSVHAVLRPPAPQVLSGEPVTGLPRVPLVRTGDDFVNGEIWEADATAHFGPEGPYTISFVATFPNNRLSDPAIADVTVTDGPDPDPAQIRAILAIGQSSDGALNDALADASSFAWRVYANRFVELQQDGTVVERPDWIAFRSPHALKYATKKQSRPSEARALEAYAKIGARKALPTGPEILALIDAQDAGTQRLFVHLVGESAAEGVLRFSSTATLSAADLDARLDAFQARANGPEVVLIVDAANSGSFLQVCKADSGQRRVVMTSGRAQDGALFLKSPSVSFTHKFCAAAWGGNNLYTSWTAARNFYSGFLNSYRNREDRIRPLIDADGNGVSDEFADRDLPLQLFLGRRFAFAGDEASGLPFILGGTESLTADPGESVALSVHLLEGVDPLDVYAQIVPPDLDLSTAITTLDRIPLTRTGPNSWTWSATLPAPTESGEHTIVFQADYSDGEESKPSEPHFGRLVVRNLSPNRDAYENDPYFDSTPDTQNFVAPSSGLQVHTLHDESDEDWGVAVCWSRSADGEIAQIPYELAFTNVSAPAGAGFMVEIFRDGRPDPGDWGATCDDSEAFDCRLFNAPGSMTWVTPGVEEIERVWWRVKWTGPPPPEGQAIGYTVELRRSTGASNGIIGSIGSDQDKSSGTRSAVVRFGLDNRLDVGGGIMYGVGELDAMRLKRSVWTMFGEPVSEMQIGPDFLPSPHCTNCSDPLLECGVERRLSPAATTCYQLLDNQLGAVPGIGVGWIVAYSVTAVVGGIELAQDWASDYYVLGAACPLAIPDCVPAANPPRIGLSPTSITRTVTQGQSPADSTVTLSNVGGGTLDYSVQSTAWASVTPSSGNVANSAELTLSFATGGLVPGVHTGSLVFTSTNADNSPQEVALSVTVTALPRLAVDPMEVSVGAEVGASPAPVGIVVSNTGGGALDFGATVRGSVVWLALEEAAGSLAGGAEQTVTLVFATESLEPGTHTATIDITAPGALGAPVALPVEVIITGSTALPGDVTGDGQVTPADANLAFRCWFEGTCPPGADALAADLCADGQLTPADAQAIFETWLGLDLSCP